MTPSWLDAPRGASWPDDGPEPNPFVRYRRLLWSWHRAVEAGWSDDDFVALIRAIDAAIASREGHGFTRTPCARCEALAIPGAVGRVIAKDETGNVGGSHKARHLMGLLLHLAVDAVDADTPLAIASCGNAAIGAATVARATGRPLDVFIPAWADAAVVETLTALYARIHVCGRRAGERPDPCMLRFEEAMADGALAFGVQASVNRWTLDGGKTIGWELADALAREPVEHAFVQVGGGALLTSCAAGLLEAAAIGPLDAAPAVHAVQSEGCAPFDRAWRGIASGGSVGARIGDAWQRRGSLMTPWESPASGATGILDDETYDWLGVARALIATGGGSIVAPESHIVEAERLVRAAGFDTDVTGTAGYAGLLTAARNGVVDADQTAAVLVAGIRRQGR